MNIEEKISRLKTLFGQRDCIDKEISILLGVSTLPKITRQVSIKKKINLPTVKHKEIKRPGKGDPRRYYCKDCRNVFESTVSKLDAVCPKCHSVHVDYASLYKK